MSAGQAILRVARLADPPIDAADEFYRDYLPQAKQALAQGVGALAIIMQHAEPDHDDWRRALARDLARAHAPRRVNVIAEGAPGSVDATLTYLEDAPGVTGQYIPAYV